MEGEIRSTECGEAEVREEGNGEKLVRDSSVDHKGRVPIRAHTGAWKATLFIITIEFGERLTYFGITTNLIIYLTKVIHQELKTAAKNVNYWTGVTTTMALIGGFIADSYTGSFCAVVISALIYLMGLSLLTMSQYIPSMRPCDADDCAQIWKIHKIIFFLALYCLSAGTGGLKPCLESLGADQFDDDHPQERRQKLSYFNLWNCALCCGLLLGVTLIVFVQDYVGWGAADLILVITMTITTGTFYAGKRFYRYRLPNGSPITLLLQVVIAAIRKRNLHAPSDPALLYEVQNPEKSEGRRLHHTERLRFLDKAAVIGERENANNDETIDPWRLQTVTRVEEMKLFLNMIPIWFCSLAFGVCVAQAPTFFVKQSATMNRKIGENFEIPSASVYAFTAIGMIISVAFYDRFLVPYLRNSTGNERGLSILRRIGFGMISSVMSMSVAALVEMKRLKTAKRQTILGTPGSSSTISVFWLVPQYMILGLGDGFTMVGLQEYFYDQAPDSMRSIGIAVFLSVIGGGSFMSSFLIIIVDHTTKALAGRSWFGRDLDSSRLDNFYWLLACLNLINLFLYAWIANGYTYKNVKPSPRVETGGDCDRTVDCNK